MRRSAIGVWVCVAACATGGSGTSPGDAGKRADRGADVHPSPRCGAAGEPCCQNAFCHAGLTCDTEGNCVTAEEAGGGDGGCPFVLCKGVCSDTMSDAKNCGQCAHDCQGNLCADGLCLATGIAVGSSPISLAVDATNLYFTDVDGTVNQVPKGGGTVIHLATGIASPHGIAVGPTSVYFTSEGHLSDMYLDGAIFSVPIGKSTADGGAAEGGADAGPAADAGAPLPIATALNQPQAIVLDGTNVYWLEPGTSTDNGSLLSCPLAGCPSNTPTVIFDMLALPLGLAIDLANVYVTTSAGNQLLAFPKATGKPKVLADMQQEPQLVAAVNGKVYWATRGDGLVQVVSAAGGPAVPVATTMGSPYAVAADLVNVYWTDMNPNPSTTFGPVDSCSVKGCPPDTPVTLVPTSQTATVLTTDALFVYWVASGGQILRVPK